MVYANGKPSKQFLSMEMHPLFIKSDESFATFEEQADKIADILVDDEKKNNFCHSESSMLLPIYSMEHECRQILEVIRKRQELQCCL